MSWPVHSWAAIFEVLARVVRIGEYLLVRDAASLTHTLGRALGEEERMGDGSVGHGHSYLLNQHGSAL